MKRRVAGGVTAVVLCLALAAIVGFATLSMPKDPGTRTAAPALDARAAQPDAPAAPQAMAPDDAPLEASAPTRVAGALGVTKVSLPSSPSAPSGDSVTPQPPSSDGSSGDPGDVREPRDPAAPIQPTPPDPRNAPTGTPPEPPAPPLPPEAPGTAVGVACVSGDMEDIISFDAPADGGPVQLYTLFRATSADGPYEAVKTAVSDGSIAWPVAETGTAWYRVGTSGPGGDGPLSESVTNAHVSIASTVGPAGGLLASSNGEVRLQLAPGSFTSPSALTIEEVEGSVVGQLISLAGVYEIMPSGTLGAPARLSIAYTVNVEHFQVASSMLAQAALMTQQGGAWVSSATNISTEGGYLSGDVSHFSYWTGAVVQPHGTSTTTYCSDGTFCHNLSTYPNSSTRYASRDPQICYNCHGSATASGPAAGSTRENVQAAINGAATVSRHPVAIGDLYCTACHDPHADPAKSPKLLKAIDAVTGKTVQGGNGITPGDAYCWTCHGTISNKRIDYLVSGYYAASKGDHKTGYTTTGHSTLVTASGVTCSGCHEEHGSAYDGLLGGRLSGSTAGTVATDRSTGAYAQACLKCHDGATAGAKNIKQHVTSGAADTSLYANGGHRIKSAGADLPVNAPLLCTDCHGAHGSKRGNKDLLSDSLGANFDTSAGAAAVRKYCFSCHTTPDLYGWDSTTGTYVAVSGTAKVHNLLRNGGANGSGPEGQGYNWLRLKTVSGHARTDTQSCYECHGSDYSSATSSNVHNPGGYSAAMHTSAPANASITIKSVSYGPLACSGCHNLELSPEHEKATASSNAADCGACHPNPRSSLTPSWSKGCVQGNCHTGGSTAPMHQNIDAAHNSPTVSCTTGSSCHSATSGLAALHANASVVVGGQTRTSCAVCHAAGIPTTRDCATCHGFGSHPPHNVAGPCIGSGCHVSDAMNIHANTVSKCQACHAPTATKTFSCGACHAAPHADENHGTTDACGSCHSTGNLMRVHGDNCAKCHPTPAQGMVYAGGCTQAGCHPGASLHYSIPGYPTWQHNPPHGDYGTCWDCHPDEGGSCYDCHDWDRDAPVTSSSVQASYTGAAVIRLNATDAVPILQTYYQVDGGSLQSGNSVTVMGPTSGTKSHSLEFWSVDTEHNTESAHKVVYFTIAAGTDSTPPTGTMSMNGGAAYGNSAVVTVNSNVTDAGTGVSAVRFNTGSGYGAWLDYWPTMQVLLPAGDGSKTLTAEYKDAFDNRLILSDAITIDTVAPSGTMSINNGATATNSTAATVNSNVSDALSGMSQMAVYVVGSGGWTAWEPYAATKNITLPAGNGTLTVYMQYRDAAGNVIQLGDSINLDTTTPSGTVQINNGSVYTSSTSVTLNSAVTDTFSGMHWMRFSNDNVTWSSWETYAVAKTWTIPEGEGTKVVYAQYQDWAGNILSIQDAIIFSNTVDGTPPTGTIAINAGAAYTNIVGVTLDLTANDGSGSGVYDMRFSNNGTTWNPWVLYSTSASWTMAGLTSPQTVYVQFRDAAGNISSSYSDQILIDTHAPYATLYINGGAAYTDTLNVTLNVSASEGMGESGVSQMRFSNDYGATWSTWEAYAASKSWTLAAGAAGHRMVYAQVKDAAGNVSGTSGNSIAYLLQYTLTYSAGANGTISGTTPQTVNYGASGTAITATGNTGYRFLGWSDGATLSAGLGVANPRTDTSIWRDINATAWFAPTNTYTVQFMTDGNGYLSAGTWVQAVALNGSTAAVTAETSDSASYTFAYWSNNFGQLLYTPTITVSGVNTDQVWTAHFNVTGTCPFLYTWDGDSYVFEADEFAAGYIGLRTSKGYRKPNPLDYHVLATTPALKDGALEYKLVEERDETDYIDEAKLYTLDAPADRDIYVERSQAEGVGLFTTLDAVIHTTARDLQAPPSVKWVNTGQDVRDLVSASDDRYVILNDNRNEGYNYQTLELDLGDVQDAPMVKLVMDGRTMVPTSPDGRAYSRTFGPQVKFEVQDSNGNWIAVPSKTEILPKPPEFDRPFVLDLTNIWVSNSRKVRLTYLYKTYFDSILLDTTADAPVTITELPLQSADIQAHGFNLRTGIGELYDYIYGAPFMGARYKIAGNYTRFGDVTPLLTTIDDKFVIFGGGDEITLRYTPPASSDDGLTRRYLFVSDGYYKTLKEDLPPTVEPLPFAAMSNYPYPATEAYPTDADHQAYISEYNTRYESD